jgi:transposase-like protein
MENAPKTALKVHRFKWTPKRSEVAVALSMGDTVAKVAEKCQVSQRAIYVWKKDVEFALELDTLSCLVGIAGKAERLRTANRIVREILESGVPTQKDLLDWLKYAQSETDGIELGVSARLNEYLTGEPERPQQISVTGTVFEEWQARCG